MSLSFRRFPDDRGRGTRELLPFFNTCDELSSGCGVEQSLILLPWPIGMADTTGISGSPLYILVEQGYMFVLRHIHFCSDTTVSLP